MSFSLLAHLYPRIKGSQEDIATYSLAYILEQSGVLNVSFTKLVFSRLHLESEDILSYHCQDADPEYGRPDIAGYTGGRLKVFCEAKFYAGLTSNQPAGYILRLQNYPESGIIFICPENRIVSLWAKLLDGAEKAGLKGHEISSYCMDYDEVRMSIISWNEVLAELIRVATEQEPSKLGDLSQLKGFCDKVESEAFIPFRPEEFAAQTARDMDRYYQVVDQTHKLLCAHKELNPSVKGLRKAPRWQGYSQYVRFDDIGVSINFFRNLWKAPTSVETPFWCHIKAIDADGKWIMSERISAYLSTIDRRKKEDFYGEMYIALEPKPYASLDEIAEDLCSQILSIVYQIGGYNNPYA